MEGYDASILTQRSRHDGGLVWDMVRNGLRTLGKRLRVSCDARLWNGMTSEQQDAYEQIGLAYSIITSGMGMGAMDLLRVRGGMGDAEYGAVLTAGYFEWARGVQRRKLDHAMALDSIVFGHSLRDIDRNRRQAKGRARSNLVMCLDVWR